MARKIRLNILGLSYSQTQTGAYALVLAEENGNRRIPIIIGGSEAQSIAIQLEGLKPLRPLTHDLFLSLATSFDVQVTEVNIFKLEEGIFYSEIICENAVRKIKIDARTSDAVALALRFECPIYTNELILSKAGIVLDVDDTEEGSKVKTEKSSAKSKSDFSKYTLEELHDLLSEAIADEDYEQASLIRDEIKKREE